MKLRVGESTGKRMKAELLCYSFLHWRNARKGQILLKNQKQQALMFGGVVLQGFLGGLGSKRFAMLWVLNLMAKE